jgi:RNA polymerase sigma-70 factor (ECF subfamily)
MPEVHETTRVWGALRTELVRFVVKRVPNEALAEDIVHDVLTKAYAHRDTLREPGKLRPWLYQIARNAIVESYRSTKPPAPLPDDLLGEEANGAIRAEQELARCLLPLVNNLPPLYQRAVTLADLEGLTQREVASSLGLSLSGAKSRVQRARKMLADSLQDCCRVEFDRRGGIADYQCPGGCGPCGGE